MSRNSDKMKSQLKILDDLAQMAGGAVDLIGDLQKQIRNEIHERIDQQLTSMNFVARQDFDRLEALVSEARKKQDMLETRINDLEEKIAANSKSSKKNSKKTTVKKSTQKAQDKKS